MPPNIIELVKTQHEPSQSSDPRTASLLHIASRTASQIAYNKLIDFDFNLTIQPNAWAVTRLNQDNLASAIDASEISCQAMLSAITGKQMQAA